MKNTLLTLAGAAAVLVVAQTSQAIPVTGNIGFAGSAQLNSGTVGAATGVVNWFGETVTANSTSGSFLPYFGSAGGQPVAIASPWSFVSGPVAAFWTASAGGETFVFNLVSSAPVVSPAGFLNVVLSGTVSGTGPVTFDTTAFNGSFSVQDPPANGIATFTESLSFHSVPDGGTTVMLLGAALSGMALIKRKFMA